MHYRQSADVSANETNSMIYSQEIEVTNRPDALYIRHHFSGLSKGRHEISWPESSIERACYLASVTSCDRLDKNGAVFIEGVNGQQSISYEIPKSGPMKLSALFKESFVTIRDSSVTSTQLHLSDETAIGGVWVTGLKQIGFKKLELTDYTLFRGSGKVTDLYWQQNSLPILVSGERLSVYGTNNDVDKFVEVENALKDIDADHSIVVIDSSVPAVHSSRFIVSDNTNVGKMTDIFLTNRIVSRFSIPSDERMIIEVMASIVGHKPVGVKKSRQAYNMLIASITKEELEQFREFLINMEGKWIDATVLDGLIDKVTGFNTSFFTKNVQEDPAIYPFLFEDSREVKVDGKDNPNLKVILKDGKTLYPARMILSQIGFSVTSNNESMYIENSNRKYRFPEKEHFYVYNEQKYDIVTIPFEVLGGDYYFEENSFKRLFLLGIEKTADTIDIVPISTLIEEAGH